MRLGNERKGMRKEEVDERREVERKCDGQTGEGAVQNVRARHFNTQ